MELKDAILSTLAEIESITETPTTPKFEEKNAFEVKEKMTLEPVIKRDEVEQTIEVSEDELKFLQSAREKLLVLFEGFQSPNNVSLDAKLDLTLNFLEYLLAKIDSRISTIKPKEII